MRIEQFIAQSEGEWNSMRSIHFLAFKQFEQVVSKISIEILHSDDSRVIDLLNHENYKHQHISTPFLMSWETVSHWETMDEHANSSGSCVLVPIPKSNKEGKLVRSIGYTEKTRISSTYKILEDDTLSLLSNYQSSTSEEKIWFLSENVRCRSAVIRTSKGSGILQTSYASEIKKLKSND